MQRLLSNAKGNSSFPEMFPKPSRAERERWSKMGDVVLLHQFNRSTHCPGSSPFTLKLETFLRAMKIEFENDFKYVVGAKGKTPYITFRGKDIADSEFIIEHLQEAFGKRLNDGLTPEQEAASRALQVTLDERFYWCLNLDYFIYNKGRNFFEINTVDMPKFTRPMFLRYLVKLTKKQTHAHGIGRHTQEEVKEITLGDLKAFSDYLGNKPYLLGETLTIADCSLFGHLCMAYYHNDDGNYIKEAIRGEFSNLLKFLDRVKENYWPDWDECLLNPKSE